MADVDKPTIIFYTGKDGELRLRIDAPGERAVSAPIGDPFSFLAIAGSQAGLEVDDTVPDQLTISIPPGA